MASPYERARGFSHPDPSSLITGEQRSEVIQHAKGVMKNKAATPTIGYGGHLEHKDPEHLKEIHAAIDRNTIGFSHPEVAMSAHKLHPNIFPNPKG